MNIDKNIFDPALLSFPDCHFLAAHAGEAPIVALAEMPATCNKVTVTQWLERFYELEELKKARGYTWIGPEAVKKSIASYLAVRAEWKKEESYGAPKNPSMYAFDTRGNAYEGAAGSDSGRVRTYFDATGNRVPFAIHIVESGSTGNWKPAWVTKRLATPGASDNDLKLIVPEGKNCVECGVKGCGHTETFRPESRSSYNAARARMSKHCRTAKSEQAAHLELHTLEFRSGKAK